MSPTPGLGWIRRVAALVPRGRRASWRKEWEAEVTWGWRRLNEHGRPGFAARSRFQLRVWSCWIDALSARMETMTMTGWIQELKFAFRSLVRHRSFAALSILTLALGIGVNTTVFTLVDGVLLRPLPYPEADRLIALQHQGRDGADELPMSTGFYQLYRDEATTLEEIGLYSTAYNNLMIDGRPERVEAQVVTPSFFDVIGVEPALGRVFVEEEGMPDGAGVAVLSHGFWRDTWGEDPEILGQTIDVNGNSVEIVGVMPEGFGFPDPGARLWLPMTINPEQAPIAAFGPSGVARMTAGTTVEGALADIQRLIDRMEEFFPGSGAVTFLREVGLAPLAYPMKEAIVGDLSSTLWVLMGTVGFVLLIACANVANLLLVRAESRQRELALRAAVGASRGQIVRWFMSESVLLATLGAIGGLIVAFLSIRLTLQFVPTDLPRMSEIGLDPRVLAFTGVVTVGCALFFGLFPLTRYGTDDLANQLRDGGGRGSTDGAERQLLRNGLVVTQMALALVLLIGSGLMYRSFQALRAVDPGFDAEGVMTAQVAVPGSVMQDWGEVETFYRQLEDRLGALPGVTAVSFVTQAPLVRQTGYISIESEDHPRGPDELPVFSALNFVGAQAVDALGLDLIEGRQLEWSDGAAGARSVMISRRMQEMWWPGESALGRRVRFGPNEEWYSIVGVVENAAQTSLEEEPQEMVYWPLSTGPVESPGIARNVLITVRTSGDPTQLLAPMRAAVGDLSPRTPLANPLALTEALDRATSRTSFTMTLLGSASSIALLLGLVGIYGVISYVVSQRTREIGVRLALGASASSVRNMVVRQGLVLAGIGMFVGLLGAFAMRSVMSSLLFGVSATDPMTWAGLSGILVLTAVAASWIPAWRASRVDPAGALRAD